MPVGCTTRSPRQALVPGCRHTCPIYMVCRALEGTGLNLCPILFQTSLHPELAGQQVLIPRVSRAGWP